MSAAKGNNLPNWRYSSRNALRSISGHWALHLQYWNEDAKFKELERPTKLMIVAWPLRLNSTKSSTGLFSPRTSYFPPTKQEKQFLSVQFQFRHRGSARSRHKAVPIRSANTTEDVLQRSLLLQQNEAGQVEWMNGSECQLRRNL